MHDAVVISDLHLGADICQVKLLKQFLKEIQTKILILNGDVFDSLNFHRMKKHHWQILGILRKMSAYTKLIWTAGNHDGPAELVSHLLGIEVVEEYALDDTLFLHGDCFDDFLTDHPVLTWFGDLIYWILQKLDRSFTLAIKAKHNSKTFLRNAEIIEERAKEYAKKKGFKKIILGHSHFPVAKPGDISYYNSGSFTELPCSYITINGKNIELFKFSA